MKIKEKRLLSPVNLRTLCIAHGWYTCGDNAEYDHLLHDLTHGGQEHMTLEDLEAVARDIIDHSIMHDEEDLCSVMWAVNHICYTTFALA